MGKITFLDAELTERCNNNCRHCYINIDMLDRAARNREVSKSTWYYILRDARDLGCEKVRFTGGEPLLRKDFLAIYEYAFKLGYEIIVATNANLITERTVNCWLNYPPKQVSISIYGWDIQSYESLTRTPGSFSRFVKGVTALREAFIPFEMKMPPVAFLIRNHDSVQHLAHSLGASNNLPFVWALSLRARPDANRSETIRRLRLSPGEAAELIFENNRDELLRRGMGIPEGSQTTIPKRIFACRAGTNRLTVNAYGFLQVCLEMRHPNTLYDLQNGSIREALEVFIPKLRKMEVRNYDYTQRCAKCSIRKFCSYCPACSWTEYGTLDKPVDYFCEVAHILANKVQEFSNSLTQSLGNIEVGSSRRAACAELTGYFASVSLGSTRDNSPVAAHG